MIHRARGASRYSPANDVFGVFDIFGVRNARTGPPSPDLCIQVTTQKGAGARRHKIRQLVQFFDPRTKRIEIWKCSSKREGRNVIVYFYREVWFGCYFKKIEEPVIMPRHLVEACG